MDNPFKGLSKGEKLAALAGGLIIVWFVYKQRQASSSSSSAIDPVTGLPASQDNVTDPMTGETYLAEATQYGSVAAAEAALAGSGSGSPYGSGAGYTGAASSLVPSNVVQGTQYGSNAAWAQAAESGLTDIGYTSTDVAAALGAYLASQPLTSAQATIVQAAIAEYGSPPVGTYTIILAPSTGPTGSGSGSGSASATVSGGHVISVSNNDAVIGWTGHNAVRYTTVIYGPGKINGHRGQTSIPTGYFSGLEAGHGYQVFVTPYNSAGQAGVAGEIHFVTT